MAHNEETPEGGSPGASELRSAGKLERTEDSQARLATQAARDLIAHPLADLFPLLEGAEFDELVADIKANGLIEPIVTLDGLILDGRNRYRACIAAQIEPVFRQFTGEDPRAFVISANIRRRHLSAAQKRDLIANLLKANPEQSDRQVAKTTGVHHETVAAVRDDLEVNGEIRHKADRKEESGRKARGRKPKETESQKQSKSPTSATRLRAMLIEATTENRRLKECIAELESVPSPPDPIENAWFRATDVERRNFAVAHRADLVRLQREEHVRQASDRAQSRADSGLDIPPDLRRAAP